MKFSTPSYFLFINFFERVVIDTYVYHKYCKSHCVVNMNLEIDTQRLVLKEKPLHQLEAQFEGFPMMSFLS
jgi:hypothetical protein